MELLRTTVLIAAVVTTGLMAGIFFIHTVAVMPGLGRADDRTFVGAFQAMDRAFMTPLFLLTFFGALVFPALAALLHLPAQVRAVLPWTLAALVLYLAVVVITMGVNVPLNNELQAAGHPEQIADLAAVRGRFEAPWVRWNLVRTLLSVPAFGLLAWALVAHGRL